MTENIQNLANRIKVLENELLRLSDIDQIRDTLTKYSRSLDWLDMPMLDEVIYDDAEIDYGFFKGNGKEFKPVLMNFERATPRRWHFTSQIKIDLQGNIAQAESYNLSLAATSEEIGKGAEIMHFCGYFHDLLERRNGKWGITKRKHILVSGAFLQEVSMEGDFAALNQIGYADTRHQDFKK